MPLGRHLCPTWVCRLQNLDLISRHCTGVKMRMKLKLLLRPGRKLCCRHGVPSSRLEKPAWAMRPRPCLRAALGTNTHWDPQREPRALVRILGGRTKGPCRIWGLPCPCPMNQGTGFPFPVPRTLLWNPSFGGSPEAENRTPPMQRNDPNLPVAGPNPRRWRLVHGPSVHPSMPRPSWTPKQRPRPEPPPHTLSSVPSRGAPLTEWRYGLPYPRPQPKPGMCFQTSVPTALAHTPSALGPLEPHRTTVPALSKETLPIPLPTTLQIRRNRPDPRGHPNKGGRPAQTGAISPKVSNDLHSGKQTDVPTNRRFTRKGP